MPSQSSLSPDPELMCGRRQIRLMLDVIIADHESLRDPGQGQWSEFRPPELIVEHDRAAGAAHHITPPAMQTERLNPSWSGKSGALG